MLKTETLFKIIIIISIILSISFIVDGYNSMLNYKYRIITIDKSYRIDKYELTNSNCIKFIDNTGSKIIVCGEYSIIEN